jgi:hypothetical protein
MTIENREPVQIFDTEAGFAPVKNLIAIGDPNVQNFGGRWWMFVGAAHAGEKVNIFSASLPPGAPLSSDEWTITTVHGDPTEAAPLVEHPEEGRWDEWLHTPSYANGHAGDGGTGPCERIYYTGSQAAPDGERLFSIGVLERNGEVWRRREEPVLRGSGERTNVLEPKVIWSQGKWRMWVMATAKEAGPDDLPDYQIHYLESDDGIGGWSDPQILFDEDDNFFDAVAIETRGGSEMVVARAPNMFGTPGFPSQGLWWLCSLEPSGDRACWSARPVPLLDADHGARWYASGTYGPSITYGDTPADRDTLYVFFTGAAVPDPDPYVLSIARLTVHRPELTGDRGNH